MGDILVGLCGGLAFHDACDLWPARRDAHAASAAIPGPDGRLARAQHRCRGGRLRDRDRRTRRRRMDFLRRHRRPRRPPIHHRPAAAEPVRLAVDPGQRDRLHRPLRHPQLARGRAETGRHRLADTADHRAARVRPARRGRRLYRSSSAPRAATIISSNAASPR